MIQQNFMFVMALLLIHQAASLAQTPQHSKPRREVAITLPDADEDRTITNAGPSVAGYAIVCNISSAFTNAGTPDVFTVTIKNLNNLVQTLPNIDPVMSFHVSVLDQSGQEVALTKYGQLIESLKLSQRLGMRNNVGGPDVVIQPGQSRTYHLPISRMFDLTLPGDYSVVCRYRVVQAEKKGIAELVSAPVLVSVTEPEVVP